MAAASAPKKIVQILEAEPMPKEQSQLELVARRFLRHRLAVVALISAFFIFAVAILAPFIAPYGINDIDIGKTFIVPFTDPAHLLGTDHLGRDLLSRIIYAARISLTVAFTATLSSTLIGMFVGSISGYYGGFLDALIMRFVEFMLTVPTLPLLLIVSSILLQRPDLLPIPAPVLDFISWLLIIPNDQAYKVVLIMMVLIAFGWMGDAQLMRGMVLAVREQQYVEAARAMGANDAYIILRHMVPNAMAPIIVSASLALGGFIVGEAALSFLGFGIQDPTPTWGNILSTAQSFMFQHPWMPLVPGFPIFLCSLVFNYVGDGLRDALDPRLKL